MFKFQEKKYFNLLFLFRTCSNLEPEIKENADVQETQDNSETEVVGADSDVAEYQEESKVERNENKLQEDTQQARNRDMLDKAKKRKLCKKGDAAAELVYIMQENTNLRRRKYENRMTAAESIKTPLDNMDDIDLFFLSMGKMTKKLPKYEQTYVKLAVSNAVLQAEQRSSERPPYASHSFVSTPLSSAQSSLAMQSPPQQSCIIEHDSNHSLDLRNERRPTVSEWPLRCQQTTLPCTEQRNFETPRYPSHTVVSTPLHSAQPSPAIQSACSQEDCLDLDHPLNFENIERRQMVSQMSSTTDNCIM